MCCAHNLCLNRGAPGVWGIAKLCSESVNSLIARMPSGSASKSPLVPSSLPPPREPCHSEHPEKTIAPSGLRQCKRHLVQLARERRVSIGLEAGFGLLRADLDATLFIQYSVCLACVASGALRYLKGNFWTRCLAWAWCC